MAAPRITYITTCKGRLDHLRQSLPCVASQPGVHCIVVDYDCPDGTAQWVTENYPQVQVVKVSNTPGFSLARARNAGAAAARSDWLALFDADILVAPDFFAKLQSQLERGTFYRVTPLTLETWGSVICEREACQRAGGYDTVYQGWGVEDDDFYSALEFLGVKQRRFEGSTVSPLNHGNVLRTRYYDVDRRISHQCNQIYRLTKLDLMRLNRTLVPLEIRESIYDQVKSRVLRQHEAATSRLEFELILPPVMFDAPDVSNTLGRHPQTRMERRLSYSVNWDDLKAE